MESCSPPGKKVVHINIDETAMAMARPMNCGYVSVPRTKKKTFIGDETALELGPQTNGLYVDGHMQRRAGCARKASSRDIGERKAADRSTRSTCTHLHYGAA